MSVLVLMYMLIPVHCIGDIAFIFRYSGSGFNETWVEPPVCYGTGDRWEDMLFTLIFAFFSVTIIDSIIIEVLDRIERKERKLFAKVQRKLLELYSKAHKHAEKMDEIERLASDDPAEQERLYVVPMPMPPARTPLQCSTIFILTCTPHILLMSSLLFLLLR